MVYIVCVLCFWCWGCGGGGQTDEFFICNCCVYCKENGPLLPLSVTKNVIRELIIYITMPMSSLTLQNTA